jgi:fumarate hydratase subunit beta
LFGTSAIRDRAVIVETAEISTPLDEERARSLRAGTKVLVSGRVYGARDAAHRRIVDLLDAGEPAPFPLDGSIVYYVGPAPAKDGHVIGPAGPTTSGRMDTLTVPLLERGLRGMIGKGYRSPEVRAAMSRYGAVYFAAIGGAAALLARHIVDQRIIAFEDLGTEAIFEFTFDRFPVVVANDAHGGEAYVR